ncbi:neuraminidase-like domain-containing protein [Enterobacter asburiae]|uniref:Tc toxin subunit A-related protein n=1 Tax=Scandinavium sp. UTDF21-P1B TaxID=3446379 RepID=UPI00348DEACE
MYDSEVIFSKLNKSGVLKKAGKALSLADIMPMSFGELRKMAGQAITWGESRYLYERAKEALKQNRLREISILSRANPQLQNAIHLNIQQSALQRGYNDLFDQRASRFTQSGSVASMFSPAGYLTELYREARELHTESSDYSLDKRRTDLQSLALSQENMIGEVSTLSISNRILFNNIQKEANKDSDKAVLEMLSTWRHMGENPFHLPHETIREVLSLQDKNLSILTKNPDIAPAFDPAELLGIKYGIFPELYSILTETITVDNADALIKKNFGGVDVKRFHNMDYLAGYYDISNNELRELLGLITTRINTSDKQEQYTNGRLLSVYISDDGEIEVNEIVREKQEVNYTDVRLNYMELLPAGGERFVCNFNFSTINRNVNSYKIEDERQYPTIFPLYEETSGTLRADKYYSIPISLKDVKEGEVIRICLSCFQGRDYAGLKYRNAVEFSFNTLSFNTVLLKINKLIRLYKATGIKPEEIFNIIGGGFGSLDIDRAILGNLLYVQHYKEIYELDSDKALVLTNKSINRNGDGNNPSLFDALFNTSLFGGRGFVADDTKLLDLDPNKVRDEEEEFLLACIKQAFQVNDIELFSLWGILNAGKTGTMACSLKNLSALYRLRLMAGIHNLSLEEFLLLYSVSPYNGVDILHVSDDYIEQQNGFFHEIISWLVERRWSVYEIFLMTTNYYSSTITSGIEKLLDNIKEAYKDNGLTKNKTGEVIMQIINAELQLNTSEKTHFVLMWADGVQPGGLKTEQFLLLAQQEVMTDQETAQIVQFCQGLAQLALIIKTLSLNESELSVILDKPEVFQRGATSLPHDISTLKKLAQFHDMLDQCGSQAPGILSALHNGMLSSSELAHALDLEPLSVAQALKIVASDKKDITTTWADIAGRATDGNQADSAPGAIPSADILKKPVIQGMPLIGRQIFSQVADLGLKLEDVRVLWKGQDDNYVWDGTQYLSKNGRASFNVTSNQLGHSYYLRVENKNDPRIYSESDVIGPVERGFQDWQEVEETLQWLNTARTFHITPAVLYELRRLHYYDVTTAFIEWEKMAESLQAGLDRNKTKVLQRVLDEKISAALSSWYINNTNLSFVTDRESLYSYLLIDNKVSAQIKTTPLAEAIASIQLYVNRAITRQEKSGLSYEVQSRQFFTDWDKYNKRYSTWAGVSQLVYYPENYIDPTIRIGQTSMMDDLLGQISQSELTQDTVEDALNQYMTCFEQVADLEIISGYHDNLNPGQGLTYLTGRDAENHQYYWRSLDHSKFDSGSGKFPANAWTEWKSVTIGANPVGDLVRPVMWQSKLWIVWIERQEIADIVDEESEAECKEEDKVEGSEVKKIEGKEEEKVKVEKAFLYNLHLSHIRLDDSWSVPRIIPLHQIQWLKEYQDDLSNLGLYCARLVSDNSIAVFPYEKSDINTNPADTSDVLLDGVYIYSDFSVEEVGEENTKYLATELDSIGTRRVNFIKEYNFDREVSLDYSWGYRALTILFGGRFFNIESNGTSKEHSLSLSADANVRIIYNGCEGTTERKQINLIKYFDSYMGKQYYLYSSVSANPHHNTAPGKACLYPVYQLSREGEAGKLLIYKESGPMSRVAAWIPDRDISIDTLTAGQSTYIENTKYHNNDFQNYIYLTESGLSTYAATDASGYYPMDTTLAAEDVKIIISAPGASDQVFLASDKDLVKDKPALLLDGTTFSFTGISFTVPDSAFKNDIAQLTVTFTAKAADDRFLGSQSGVLNITRKSDYRILTIGKTDTGAQYLQYGPYRTRINTLFARQLTERASISLNRVLNMETQLLPEPQLGTGGYIQVTLPAYDKNKHGNSRSATLSFYRGNNHATEDSVLDGYYAFWNGMLTDSEQTITLFIPVSFLYQGNGINFPYSNTLTLYLVCDKGKLEAGSLIVDTSTVSLKKYNAVTGSPLTVSIQPGYQEPMDFSGANALYFWEMFYYTPMMVFQRLFRENRFDDALHWLKYVWNPEGYFKNGQPALYSWNCRPLEDDTSWNSAPLDSVDPDAVAQNDPMHYKVYVFMCMLDLLLARGDFAYRQLERDTLNEAKMWYVQALNLLGHEPYLTEGGWDDPLLKDAADQTKQTQYQAELFVLDQTGIASHEAIRTANSLVRFFLPQFNEKLSNYWQVLTQRLYNLRHNLSIDGQPLNLPVFALPADPKALLTAAASVSQGGAGLPPAFLSLYRFQPMLENAKSLVSQLIQFGATLLSIIERQDAEALAELLQNQGQELALQSIKIQETQVEEIDKDIAALKEGEASATLRYQTYKALYDENISGEEKRAMDVSLYTSSIGGGIAGGGYMAAAILNMFPNHYGATGGLAIGVAIGGIQIGGIAAAIGQGGDLAVRGGQIAADRISQFENYRRRREEWKLQYGMAEKEKKQLACQIEAIGLRRQAAVMQKTYLETQQKQMQSHLEFLTGKFSNKSLYSWLRGVLAGIYYQFYDITVSRCLMAQQAYEWHFGIKNANFIKPGGWQNSQAGLMSGETLMLALMRMEDLYLRKDERALEVVRTVSLADVYDSPGEHAFKLKDQIKAILSSGSGDAGTQTNGLHIDDKQSLIAQVKLDDLAIRRDYPEDAGGLRRIKQISVSLPMLMGPYQDVQALLSYGGGLGMPRGCDAIAVSHGINDSGQFLLDFNDARYLPFEGIPVDDSGVLSLSFPNAMGKQKTLLQSMTDIILHIRYTIVQSDDVTHRHMDNC